jgi:hypothetical protein
MTSIKSKRLKPLNEINIVILNCGAWDAHRDFPNPRNGTSSQFLTDTLKGPHELAQWAAPGPRAISWVLPLATNYNRRCWSSTAQSFLLVENRVHLMRHVYSRQNPHVTHATDRLCSLVVRVSDYRSRGPGFDSLPYQIFWEVWDLSLVRTIEELLA